MATEITKEEVELPVGYRGCVAFVLYNVFIKEECDEHIRLAEQKGFETALLNVGGNQQVLRTDIKNSSRCTWDSAEEVDKIWKRIRTFIPEITHFKVRPGGYFKPHYDGQYKRDNGERSYVTIQIYLNEGFTAESTTFIGTDGKRQEVVPKTGSILIFEQPILHEGSKLKSGRK